MRRRTQLLLLLCTVALAVTGGCAEGSRSAGDGAVGAAAPPPLAHGGLYFEGIYGIRVEGQFSLPEDRRLLGAEVHVAGSIDDDPEFYPENWVDDDESPPPRPFVPADMVVGIGSSVIPDCAARSADPPLLVVFSKVPGGEPVEDRFSIARTAPGEESDGVPRAVERFCERVVQADVSGASASADGDRVSVTYAVVNPGPSDATVTSRAWADGEARWLPAVIEVKGNGEIHELQVMGLGGVCRSSGARGPLPMGLLVASFTGSDRSQPIRGSTVTQVC